MRFYGVDLARDLGSDRLSWRRLGVLLRHLPRESATVRELGEGRSEWGYVEHLLAALIDSVGQTNWLIAATNSKQRPPSPKPIDRPGYTTTKPAGPQRRLTPAQIDAILIKAKEGVT